MALSDLRYSEIECPVCHFRKVERMPDDRCLYLYVCNRCKALLRPTKGRCCVFCSFGSLPCPPSQSGAMPDRCFLSAGWDHGAEHPAAPWEGRVIAG